MSAATERTPRSGSGPGSGHALVSRSPAAGAGGPPDDEVADQVREHHAAMVAELDRLTAALADAPEADREPARRRLEDWFSTTLVPHADEEEATTYRAASELAEGRLLVEAMVREHVLIKQLVADVADAGPSTAAASARAVLLAFTSHQAKENDLVLPLLVAAPGITLSEVLEGAHGHQTGAPADVGVRSPEPARRPVHPAHHEGVVATR